MPDWTQLLDLAARLCPVPEATRQWFSMFTNRDGVSDANTVTDNAKSYARRCYSTGTRLWPHWLQVLETRSLRRLSRHGCMLLIQ